MRLEGAFERSGRIRAAEYSEPTVPNRWARVGKDLSQNVFEFTRGATLTRGVTKMRVSDADLNCLAGDVSVKY